MEPIPETLEALRRLGPVERATFSSDLSELAQEAQRLVPQLVGVSVAASDNGLAFTLVASAADAVVLDATQYLDDGPCVTAVKREGVAEFRHDSTFDEEQWRTFAGVAAARGIRATLTLPVVVEGRTVGSINLYASEVDAFEGRHDELADVFGAWAQGAVTNADLSFRTRVEAEHTPGRIETIAQAMRLVARRHGVDLVGARDLIQQAARRAGITQAELARAVLEGGQPDL